MIMAGVVAIVRATMLAAEAHSSLVLAASVASGALTYLAWLWLTDSEAIREARLAWSHLARAHSSQAARG